MNNLEFEVTGSSVAEVKGRIEEIRALFGEEPYITAKITDDKRNKSFDIINDGLAKISEQIQKKMGGKE